MVYISDLISLQEHINEEVDRRLFSSSGFSTVPIKAKGGSAGHNLYVFRIDPSFVKVRSLAEGHEPIKYDLVKAGVSNTTNGDYSNYKTRFQRLKTAWHGKIRIGCKSMSTTDLKFTNQLITYRYSGILSTIKKLSVSFDELRVTENLY